MLRTPIVYVTSHEYSCLMQHQFCLQLLIYIGMQGADIRGGEPRGLPLNIKILPEHLRGLGYTTKLIGKWHMGYYTPQYTPLHRGFDTFLGFYNSYISYYDYSYSNQVRC